MDTGAFVTGVLLPEGRDSNYTHDRSSGRCSPEHARALRLVSAVGATAGRGAENTSLGTGIPSKETGHVGHLFDQSRWVILVTSACHHKTAQTVWPKQQKSALPGPAAGGLRSRCPQGAFLLRPLS